MRLLIQILLTFTAFYGLTFALDCDQDIADTCVEAGAEVYNACGQDAENDAELSECECAALYAEYSCYFTCTDDPARETYLDQLVAGCTQFETDSEAVTAALADPIGFVAGQ
ncbi:hypothetical protein Q9L58_009557 [Maublancomyces gigas]|uniref:Uncharacterized protein n=1 Tax=Discina gigas TaxID=1032678 RepID=A0ABR3G6J2_9PEZI